MTIFRDIQRKSQKGKKPQAIPQPGDFESQPNPLATDAGQSQILDDHASKSFAAQNEPDEVSNQAPSDEGPDAVPVPDAPAQDTPDAPSSEQPDSPPPAQAQALNLDDFAPKPSEAPPTPPPQPKDQLAGMQDYQQKRPARDSMLSGLALAEQGANQIAGTKSAGFYPGLQAKEEQAQKDWTTDQGSRQKMIEDYLSRKFEGEQHTQKQTFQGQQGDLNRGVQTQKMTLEEKIKDLDRQEREATAAGNDARTRQIAAQRFAIQQQLGEDRNTRAALQRENADKLNMRTNTTNREIFTQKEANRGSEDLAKNVNKGLMDSLDNIDQKINGPEGEHLLRSVSGVRGAIGNVPIVGPYTLGSDQTQFKSEVLQPLLEARHGIVGSSMTAGEKAMFDQAMGLANSGNPATAKQGLNTMIKMVRGKVQGQAAGQPKGAVEQYLRGGGNLGPAVMNELQDVTDDLE